MDYFTSTAMKQGHGDEYFVVGWCAVHAAKRLEPNIYILVLLPPLIYESASNIDWNIFKRWYLKKHREKLF